MTYMNVTTARQHAQQAGRGSRSDLADLLRSLVNAEVYEKNAGNPNGSVVPKASGAWLLDTTNNIWYRSKGTANTDWVSVGTHGLTAAELGFLDGVTAGTSAASKALVLDANSKLDGVPLVQRTLTALTTTNLENLAATPIEVIAAPDAGKFIQVLAWRFRLIFGATAIDDAAADGDLTLKYAGGSTIDTMEADGLVDAGADTQGLSGNLTELIVAESGIDAKAVQISNDGAEFTVTGGGDSTAEVEVWYRVLDSNPS